MSIYGTAGTGTYSVSYPNLDAMMNDLKDNTSGAILASTLRNTVLTLWYANGTASIPSSNISYTNNTPSTQTIGGLTAGTDFSAGVSLQEILDLMLHPYVLPTINYFNISNGSGGPWVTDLNLEYGSAVNNIYQRYSITNGSINLLVPPPAPTNPIILNGTPTFNFNGSQPKYFYTLATQSGIITLSANNDSIITLSVNDSINIVTKTASVTFFNKFYWGNSIKGITSSYTSTDILTANGASVSISLNTGNILTDTRVQNLNGINGNGNYLFFAFPTSFGTPTFIANGLVNTAFTQQTLNFTNINGYAASYSVWVSNTQQNSPIGQFQII